MSSALTLTLAHCAKEWRAQRGLLAGYTVLVFASLCLGFLSASDDWWREGNSALALSWFVAAGVIGVVAFAAPTLVRGEFGAKDDQFVRRMPGALGASFAGKLLFLLLATAAMPLLGLSAGELFLSAIDRPWHELVEWQEALNEYRFEWPWPLVLCGYAVLLVPWVWAIGTWLPNGRMAIGGTAVFVLLLGLGVVAVLRFNPQIEQGLHWRPWRWTIAPAGVVVAFASWAIGRRGGGALRSAKFGFAAFAVCALPPSLWLGDAVSHFRHPDPQRLATLHVTGITPDQRFVLAYGTENENWYPAPFRIDLQAGAATQIGAHHFGFSSEIPGLPRCGPVGRQFLVVDDEARTSEDPVRNETVFDLADGSFIVVRTDARDWRSLAAATSLAETIRETTAMRAPGSARMWVWDGALQVESTNGRVTSTPLPVKGSVSVHGHGLCVWNGRSHWFDSDAAEVQLPLPADDRLAVWCVRDRWVFRPPNTETTRGWHLREPDGSIVSCELLRDAFVLGLFDDDTLLCAANDEKRIATLFLFRPAGGNRRDLAMPATPIRGPSAMAPMAVTGSLLARDPAGRIWLRAGVGFDDNRGDLREIVVLLDTASLAATTCLPHTRYVRDRYALLGWSAEHGALLQRGGRIVRFDVATSTETVLFPRE